MSDWKVKRIKQLNKLFSLILVVEVIIISGLAFTLKKLSKDRINPNDINDSKEDIVQTISSESVLSEATDEPLEDTEPIYVSFTLVGDIMMHQWQIQRSYDAATDTFDVSDGFEYIKKYLCDADYTIGNLETTMSGRYNGCMTDVLGYSGYPMFNAPEVLADTLKDIGFDFLQTANNHCLDSGEQGIYTTIDTLDAAGLKHTGTFKSQEANDELCIIDVNGITFGFVAYTYDLNGMQYPQNARYAISTLEMYSDSRLEELYAKVRALDEAGVDFVCPMIHFGTEYRATPDDWQEMVVDGLFENGADIIYGGHPHVIEPMDIRTITNPDGSTRTGYVFYALGDFISGSIYDYDGVDKDLGIIANLKFSKQVINGEKTTRVEEISIVPTHVYWTDETIGVVPVLEALDNRDEYSFLSAKNWERMEYSKEHVIELLTSYGNLNYHLEKDRYIIETKK